MNTPLLFATGFALGATVAHLSRRRTRPASTVGAITGPKNPCNLFIEAHRQDNGRATPDPEMLMTYRDLSDPGIMSECALLLSQRARKKGVKPAEESERLRTGMALWYSRGPAGSVAYAPRGGVTFGA